MPIGDTRKENISAGGFPVVICGSAQSDWIIANVETKTVQSSAELLRPASTNDSNVTPIEVPAGLTRFLWSLRFPIATTTLTTDPVFRFFGADLSGRVMRLDNEDNSATGIKITHAGESPSTTAIWLNDGTYYYTDVYDLEGMDLRGCKTLYVLVETASNYTDGATSQTGVVQVKFLN